MDTEEINSLKTDKMEAMDYVIKCVTEKGYDLRLISHLREDENGNHIFTVYYDSKSSVAHAIADSEPA